LRAFDRYGWVLARGNRVYEAKDQEQRYDERAQQAQARGESLRGEIKTRLRSEGARSAADLLPHLPKDVSLAEVAFQLERLAEEGETVGETGGPYSLA
jgi:hypothetical protein